MSFTGTHTALTADTPCAVKIIVVSILSYALLINLNR